MTFREVDFDAGTDVAGGCTPKLGTVMFTLKQTEIADTFANQAPQGNTTLNEGMRAAIARHQAHLLEAQQQDAQ